MHAILAAAIAAISAFVATNIDDIVVLMLFFGQRGRQYLSWQIVAGQYLGFLVLILASLPGVLGGLILPRTWLGLLGMLPIAIGISHLLQNQAAEFVQTISPAPPSHDARSDNASHSPRPGGSLRRLTSKVIQVAAVTVANGGDNLGIYVPLFASSTLTDLVVVLLTFLVMIAVW